jgi:hypothetical protein
MQRVGRSISLSVVFVALVSVSVATAQNAANDSPVTFTAEQDHQNMMDQLGIKQVVGTVIRMIPAITLASRVIGSPFLSDFNRPKKPLVVIQLLYRSCCESQNQVSRHEPCAPGAQPSNHLAGVDYSLSALKGPQDLGYFGAGLVHLVGP